MAKPTNFAKMMMYSRLSGGMHGERRRRDDPMDGERMFRMGYDSPHERRPMGFGHPDHEPYEARRRRDDEPRMHYGSHESGPIRFGGMVSMDGSGRTGYHKITREMAEEWVGNLEGSDPSKPHGGKWTPDQVKPIAQKYGVPTEGDRFWEFWAVMNVLYSDYYGVAKKYSVLNPDFFADMAMAFINDEDAVDNKTAAYYECVVEH